MTLGNSTDNLKHYVLRKVEDFNISGQYYLLRNFLNDALDFSEHLSDEAKCLLIHILEIQVNCLKQVDNADLDEMLLKDMELEKSKK
jgi:hypothetical protein